MLKSVYFPNLKVDELLRDPGLAVLRAPEELPQLRHEGARVLPVEEAGQIDLHLARVNLLDRDGDQLNSVLSFYNISQVFHLPYFQPIFL